MRKVAFLTAGALIGAAAYAQSPLECVDPHVLRALVFPGSSARSVVVSYGIPDELATVATPSEFTLIGNTARDLGTVLGATSARSVMTVFRSNSPVDAARTAALDALAAAGWEIQPPQTPMGSGVFVSPGQLPVAQAACRDGKSINVVARELDGRTYVSYGVSTGNSACDPSSSPMYSSRAPLDEYLPTLALPTDPNTGAPARMRGSGGSSNSGGRSVRSEFRVAESLRNVAGDFARQMNEQGWAADATWSGDTTAGSSWTKETATGTLLGSLRVTAVADGEFTAVLNITPIS